MQRMMEMAVRIQIHHQVLASLDNLLLIIEIFGQHLLFMSEVTLFLYIIIHVRNFYKNMVIWFTFSLDEYRNI